MGPSHRFPVSVSRKLSTLTLASAQQQRRQLLLPAAQATAPAAAAPNGGATGEGARCRNAAGLETVLSERDSLGASPREVHSVFSHSRPRWPLSSSLKSFCAISPTLASILRGTSASLVQLPLPPSSSGQPRFFSETAAGSSSGPGENGRSTLSGTLEGGNDQGGDMNVEKLMRAAASGENNGVEEGEVAEFVAEGESDEGYDGNEYEGEGEIGEEGENEEEGDEYDSEGVDLLAEEEESDSALMTGIEAQMVGAPKRVQRFLIQKMLKVKPAEPPSLSHMRKRFQMRIVDINRTAKVTKGGKVISFAALVVCGNGEGVIGFGRGKSAEVGAAVDKAFARSLRNLHYFERYQGRTVVREQMAKFGKTKVYLWPARKGSGMSAGKTVGGILRLAGFKAVKTKVIGSRNPINTVKATFKALGLVDSQDAAITPSPPAAVSASRRALV